MTHRTALVALVAASVGLSGCTGFAQFVKDSDATPNCYRDVQAKFATVFVFMYPVPILTEGSYRKVCNKEQAPGAPPSLIQPLTVGTVVGASGR